VRLKGSTHATTAGYGGYGGGAAASLNESGYQVGERVFHQKFGEGMVLATEGAGDHARIQVNFNHAGTKWLVAAFAKLEKL
jgi:DNA helicase-2/ATP-dependent DNA helicase PcrA